MAARAHRIENGVCNTLSGMASLGWEEEQDVIKFLHRLFRNTKTKSVWWLSDDKWSDDCTKEGTERRKQILRDAAVYVEMTGDVGQRKKRIL